MSASLLHHALITAPGVSPEGWIMVLHGIFGMGRNWSQLCRQLVLARPTMGMVLVDLRLHGHSKGFLPPHTLDTCAEDLERLANHLPGPVTGVMGHSFGGKVALVLAERRRLPTLKQVLVLDSTPELGRSATPVLSVLQAMQALPMPAATRAEVVAGLQTHGLSETTAQWLATNLEGVGKSFVWRFDFPGLEALIGSFFQRSLWNVLEDPNSPKLHVVKAAQSDVLDEPALARIQAQSQANPARVRLYTLPNAGHWLHVDNPDGLLTLLLDALG